MKKKVIAAGMILLLCTVTSLADEWSQEILAERASADSILANRPTSPFAAIGQTVLRSDLPLRVVLAADTLLLGHPSADPGLPQLEITWKKELGVAYIRSPQGGDFKLNRSEEHTSELQSH